MEGLYVVVGGTLFFTAILASFAWAASTGVGRRVIQGLIYAKDGETIAERCDGPDRFGKCPRGTLECPVACTERWIIPMSVTGNMGKRFWVSADEELCPLTHVPLARVA